MSPTPKTKGKRYYLEFSGTSAFFGALAFIFLLAWIFFLGILAGRGFFSEGLDTLAVRIFPMLNRQAGPDKDRTRWSATKKVDKAPSFQFYKGLSDTEEEKKDLSDAKNGEKEARPERGVKPSTSPGGYTVQLASLGSENQALKMVHRLVLKGHEAYFYKIIIRDKAYFRVMCGRFKSRQEADDLQKLLAGLENIKKGFVTKVEEE